MTPEEGQSFYSASPFITDVQASTVGTVGAVNAELIHDELLGRSEGVPGERFQLSRTPVVPGDEPFVVETGSEEGWLQWLTVEGFGESGPNDRHVMLDATTGEITFGPAVRLADSSIEYHGAVPEKGSLVRVPSYRTGGGSIGNVSRGAISVPVVHSIRQPGREPRAGAGRGGRRVG